MKNLNIRQFINDEILQNQFAEALRAGQLPEKFFYTIPESANAWLELCANNQYKNYSRSKEILEQHSDQFCHQLPAGNVEVISLGAGQGDKDRIILQALVNQQRGVFYYPVDTSLPLLEIACQGAAELGIHYQGIWADIEDDAQLEQIFQNKKGVRLILLLGSTLGALEPVMFLQRLKKCLGADDFLLIDGEIYSEAVIQEYDNPTNRRFAFAPLANMGIGEEDGDLRFEMVSDPNLKDLWKLTKYFIPRHDLSVSVANQKIILNKGNKLRMSASCKYNSGYLARLLKDHGQLSCLNEQHSRDHQFTICLVCAP